jgi:hypothetical protein
MGSNSKIAICVHCAFWQIAERILPMRASWFVRPGSLSYRVRLWIAVRAFGWGERWNEAEYKEAPNAK